MFLGIQPAVGEGLSVMADRPNPPSQKQCTFFTSGRCTRGESCRFVHGLGNEDSQSGARQSGARSRETGGGRTERGSSSGGDTGNRRGKQKQRRDRASKPQRRSETVAVGHSEVTVLEESAMAGGAITAGHAATPNLHAPIEDEVQDELDLLKEIYVDTVNVQHRSVSMEVRPRTDHQFVRVLVQIVLVSGYPTVAPIVRLNRPLGLSEGALTALRSAVTEVICELTGDPLTYQLLERITEFVTEHHLPSELCAICRGEFTDPKDVIMTDCEHFLHPWCTLEYAEHLDNECGACDAPDTHSPSMSREEPRCPVCRSEINIAQLRDCARALKHAGARCATADTGTAPADWRTPDVIAAQADRESIFTRQAERGGLIEKKTEILITETTLSEQATPTSHN